MLHKEFVFAHNEDYGIDGWLEVGKEHFQPLGSLATAHDVLEHFEDDRGTIQDEIMALGASLHVREYDSSRQHEHWKNIIADFTEIYRLHRFDGYEFADPLTHMLVPLNENFKYTEHQIKKVVEACPQFLIDNVLGDEDEREGEKEHLQSFAKKAEGWLRHGYRRARRRYGQDYYGWLYNIFRTIQDTAEKSSKDANPESRLFVNVNIKRQTVSIQMQEYEYPRTRRDYA